MTDPDRERCPSYSDQDDFERFLVEYGFSPEAVRVIVEREEDMIPMPAGVNKLELLPSAIQGYGLFATCKIEAGEVLAPARISGMRTPAGRFTNHSIRPNARFAPLSTGDLLMVAACSVAKGEELTIDYRQVGSINGAFIQPSKQEAIRTLRIRCPNLPEEIYGRAEAVFDAMGYLPAVFVQMMAVLPAHPHHEGATTGGD